MDCSRTWLASLRNEKGFTMKQVAKGGGVSESYYCLIEAGKRRPTPDTAKKIAKTLDFDWTRFYEDTPA